MVNPALAQRLLLSYLNSLGVSVTEEKLTEIHNTDAFNSALLFIKERYDDRLTLAAIGSSDAKTAEDFREERNRLFALLTASLDFNNSTRTFGNFNPRLMNVGWLEQERKMDVNALRNLHADPRNQSINEKFFSGRLHGQEWLNDLDLQRLLSSVGLSDRVTVTRLNADDIGMALHFARLAHKDEKKPYTVNLLLNKGNVGDITSQGSHWFETAITIDPSVPPPTIKVEMDDSLSISKEEEKRTIDVIAKAMKYREITGTPPLRQEFAAFPDAKIADADVKVTSGGQRDGWSCGYRAFSRVINRIGVDNLDKKHQALAKNFVDCKGDSAALRAQVYHSLLGGIQIPEAMMANSPLPSEAFKKESGSKKEENVVTLNGNFLSDYLGMVAKTGPRTAAANLSSQALKEQFALTKEIDIQFKRISTMSKVEEVQRATSQVKNTVPVNSETHKRVHIDFLTLFDSSIAADKVKIKAAMLALIKLLNENKISELTISNAGQLPPQLTAEHAELFEQLAFINEVKYDGRDEKLRQTFNETVARNKLIKLLNVQIDPEENIWQQLYQARLSNPALYSDNMAAKGELHVFSAANNPPERRKEINRLLLDASVKPIQEQLRFIHQYRSFIEAHEEQFPFRTLMLMDKPYGGILQSSDPNYAEKILDVLAQHLESGQYFPFENIQLEISNLSEDGFEKLKRMLNALEHYPHINSIRLAIGSPEIAYQDLTVQQSEELQEIFTRAKLTCLFKVLRSKPKTGSEENADRISASYQLHNVIAVNRRKKNIMLRKQKLSATEKKATLEKKEESRVATPLKRPSDKRACKLSGFNPQQSLSFDISVEQQAEQQHQLQTQLQQEVQQATQIQAQQQNEVGDSIGLDGAGQLVDHQAYVADREVNTTDMTHSSAYQCSALQPRAQEDLWTTFTGEQGVMTNSVRFLTPSAIARIHSLPQYFLSGVNIDNLPTGFFLQKHPSNSGLVLCYDATKFVENKNQSPLTPVLRLRPPHTEWIGDLRQFDAKAEDDKTFWGLLWSDGRHDSRIATPDHLFKIAKLENAELGEQILKKHAWCLEENKEVDDVVLVGGEREDAFLQKNEIFALIDVVYHEGCEGLMVFLDALQVLYQAEPNHDLYRHFKKRFINADTDIPLSSRSRKTVTDLMSERSLKIITELSKLTPTQKIWWKKIVDLQLVGVGYLDLEQLYDGFTYFLKKLSEGRPNAIELPEKCPLEGDNPLVELDRLLAILGKVPGANLIDQMGNLNDLSFAADGAWYAARYEGFHYFHPKMQLQQKTINYDLDDDEKKLKQLKQLDRNRSYKVTYEMLRNPSAVQKAENDEAKQIAASPGLRARLGIEPDYAMAETLFHRYVGRCEKIAVPYDKYVKLTGSLNDLKAIKPSTKIKLLPLLAIATTGPRGSREVDSEALYKFVASQHPVGIDRSLELIAKKLNGLSEKPTLAELTGLVSLVHESKDAKAAVATLMAEPITEKLLQSWKMWQDNANHLSAEEYINFFAACKEVKAVVVASEEKTISAEEISSWGQIAALLQGPCSAADLANLKPLLATARACGGQYSVMLKMLASINMEKTPAAALPNVGNILRVLQDFATNSASLQNFNQTFVFLARALPGCVFNQAAAESMPDLELDIKLLEKIGAFNSLLKSLDLPTWDAGRLQGEDGIRYLQAEYTQLMEVAPKKIAENPDILPAPVRAIISVLPEALVFPHISAYIQSKVSEFLEGCFLQGLAGRMAVFPDLARLKERFAPPPRITGNSATLGDEVTALQNYATSLDGLFDVLSRLRSKWGASFNLEFLFNSPCAASYTQRDLKKIFDAVSELQFDFIPTTLLQAVFPAGALPATAKPEELSGYLAEIIQMQDLSFKQKIEVINTVYKNAETSGFVKSLVDGLKRVRQAHSAVQDQALRIWLRAVEEKQDPSIDATCKLVELFKAEKKDGVDDKHQLDEKAKSEGLNHAPVIAILFQRLSHFPQKQEKNDEKKTETDYKKLLNALNKVGEDDKKDFLKIVSYGFFKHDDDAKSSDAVFKATDELVAFSKDHPEDFKALAKLYDGLPRPRLKRVRELLKHPEQMKNFDLDPSGGRAQKADLNKQFNIDTIHERIDAAMDLGRDTKHGQPAPLLLTHRQRLQEGMSYITAVGKEFPLVIPGATAATVELNDCHKAVKDLTSAQIKELIKHYRKVISGKIPVNAHDLWIAKLEFAALTREALYRVDGRFAYDTQMLALLNLMLQGGNVFSEVRTGEGKSLITAFFAAFKWAEGGAVDVLSSNMSLAARDLEECQDFFEYLGIKTALIRASSPYEAYQQDGINYSEISEMSLSQEQRLLNGEQLPERVSAVIDEVDFTVLDNTTQFRYATSLDSGFDPHYNPNQNLYPLILNFVKSRAFLDADCSNDEDIENLREFVKNYPLDSNVTKDLKAKFRSLSNEVLDRWINSAYLATQLRENEDYVVRPGTIIKNEVPVAVLQARVKINHRENPDSRFSDGTHQFLHTLLNMQRGTDLFPIEPEKTYLASRSAKNTLDYYLRGTPRRGDVVGLTGTIGTFQDCNELHRNYGAKFFRIPPNKKLRRHDFPPLLAKRKGWFIKEDAKTAHFRTIFENIMEARRRGQSILIICDGVASSNELHEYLKTQWARLRLPGDMLTLFNGEQDTNETDVVRAAGKPGKVTISTPMFGRGTDIKPVDELGERPNPAGLHVVPTYISEDREYGQCVGRAARNGQIGSSALILSEAAFTSRGRAVPRGARALATSINDIRLEMAAKKTKERYERQLFSNVKDQFFLQYTDLCRVIKHGIENSLTQVRTNYKPLQREVTHQNFKKWEAWLRKVDNQWGEMLTALRNEMDAFGQQKRDEINRLPSIERGRRLAALPAELEAEERRRLAIKIESFTNFAREAWAVTHDAILLDSNALLEQAYGEARQRMVNNPDAVALAVSPSKIDAAQSPAADYDLVKLDFSPAVLPSEKPAQLTHDMEKVSHKMEDFPEEKSSLNVRIDPLALGGVTDDIQIADSYVRLAGQSTTLDQASIAKHNKEMLLTICNGIRNIIPSEACSVWPKDVSSEVRVNGLMRALLKKQYDSAYRERPIPFTYPRLINRLMDAVMRYGQAADRQFLSQAIDEHLHVATRDYQRSNKNLGNYVLRIVQHKQLVTSQQPSSDPAGWGQLYALALKRVTNYRNAWFAWRSADRNRAADTLLIGMRFINDRTEYSDKAKVEYLLKLLDEASGSIVATDLEEDKKRKLLFHRNAEGGSRLQNIISDIRAYATTVDAALPSVAPVTSTTGQVRFAGDFKHIAASLKNLSERVAIANLKRFHVTTATLPETKVGTLQKSLAENYQELSLFREQLKNCVRMMSEARGLETSQQAFLYLVNENIQRIDLLMQRVALDPAHRSDLHATEGRLRESMQESLSKLAMRAESHPLSQARIETMARYGFVLEEQVKKAEDRPLLAKALHEIERLATLSYPDVEKFEYGKISYQNGILHVDAKFESGNQEGHFSMDVSGLVRHGMQVVCQWPQVKLHSKSTPTTSVSTSSTSEPLSTYDADAPEGQRPPPMATVALSPKDRPVVDDAYRPETPSGPVIK
jgi:preprotein translocase subunit SecA